MKFFDYDIPDGWDFTLGLPGETIPIENERVQIPLIGTNILGETKTVMLNCRYTSDDGCTRDIRRQLPLAFTQFKPLDALDAMRATL